MKREATTHTKMVRLERRLDIRHYEAVGLLELLWHLTAKEAPSGNIGKLSDEDIASALGWEFDPEQLIDALVLSKWLERHETYRLIIHDWREHCEDSVHTKLARARCLFVDGSVPSFNRSTKAQKELYEKEAAEGKFKAPKSLHEVPISTLRSAHEVQYHALPNQTKPNQTKPFSPEKNSNEQPANLPDPFVDFQNGFVGEFPDDTWRSFMSHVNTPERLVSFQKNFPLWMKTKKYQDGFGKDAKWFIKSGVWKNPPGVELMLAKGRDSPAPNMYPDADDWKKGIDLEELKREREGPAKQPGK